jgi:hypothetical protein
MQTNPMNPTFSEKQAARKRRSRRSVPLSPASPSAPPPEAGAVRFQVRYPGRLGHIQHLEVADESEANQKLDHLEKGCIRRVEFGDRHGLVRSVRTIRTKGGYIA